jgi:hypothetical protein
MATELMNLIALRKYVTGGNATFTLKSNLSGDHVTYRVRKGKADNAPHFVSLLGDSGYTFLGTVFPDGYRHGHRSAISPNHKAARGFEWLWRNIDSLPECAQFIPSTKCCVCGRELTTPESVARGIGPECATRHL